MRPPDYTAASIVLLGSFNPSIFHPSWFKLNKLIRDQEADDAKLEITHIQVSSFSTDFFKVNVFPNRFSIETADSLHFEMMRDLVMGTFSILEHTPVSKMGINLITHFKMLNLEEWHAVGHRLAPKEPWNKIMGKPGLISLVMEDPRNEPRGYVRVKVQPSPMFQPGLYIEVNNHYEAADENAIKTLMEILSNSWQEIFNSSNEKAQHLLNGRH